MNASETYRPAPVRPNDSSDSASDLIGAADWRAESEPPGRGPASLDAATDAGGTGERPGVAEAAEATPGIDIGVDRVIDADEARLGGGKDQAEEAWAGEQDDPPAPGVGDDS